MSYERDEASFREAWEGEEVALSRKIREARDRLPDVAFGDDLLLLSSKLCVELGVTSLRADLALCRAASSLAAWEGRTEVGADDIKRASKWALAHRRRRRPFDSPEDEPDAGEVLDRMMKDDSHNDSPPPQQPPSQERPSEGEDGGHGQRPNHEEEPMDEDPTTTDRDDSSSTEQDDKGDCDRNDDGGGKGQPMQTFTASMPGQIKRLRLPRASKQRPRDDGAQCATRGRRDVVGESQRHKSRRVRSAETEEPVDVALDATLRAASANGLSEDGRPIVRPENWRRKVFAAASETVVLFAVDASGSMSARKRMEAVKGATLALLEDARRNRDRVGVVAFRGPKAEAILAPTRSAVEAAERLRRLPTGGRTPLAHALEVCRETVEGLRRRDPDAAVLLVLLGDGRGNVPLPESSCAGGAASSAAADREDAWSQTKLAAGQLARLSVPTLVLDTEAGHVRIGRAKELGKLLNADCMRLEDLTADGLVHTVRQTLRA